jgi:hypothetical protein
MRRLLALSLAAVAAAYGCSAASPPPYEGGDSSGSGSGGMGGDLGLTTGAGGQGTPTDCDEAATFVYVLSTDNDLYRFKPQDKLFEKIGPLACPTNLQPNSMAVDRTATAWVNYVDSDITGDSAGQIFRVSTADASCTGPITNLPSGWFRLGMGFSTDAANGVTERLYLTGTADGASPGLGVLDGTTFAVNPIGNFTGTLSGQNAELTGTGDARLFGFFTTTPVEVAEIDKGTGAILGSTKLPAVETPAAWAFTFWGGDFYLYTAPDTTFEPGRTTNVTRFRPSDGSVDAAYMTNIGFTIVGAGVSTCAPVEEPK